MQPFTSQPVAPMTREDRLHELRRLIAAGAYRTQGELADALRGAGWEVTQSSISRDIRALGLEKIDGVYVTPAQLALEAGAGAAGITLPWGHVRSLVRAGDNMIVLRTDVATAQQVAAAIDAAPWEGVAGTIAGDDTVFVATASRAASDALCRRLQALAGLKDRRPD
ncbi:MAG: arginine repressor [Myxococcales bacterium]|nr:arginine repressor [Myxococcales bacterium]